MGRLERVANTKVVSYGGTLTRAGKSVSTTMRFLEGGKRTGTRGGTKEVTTRNVIGAIIGSSGITTVMRMGSRASFITGGSRFRKFMRTITGRMMSSRTTSLSTFVTRT